MLKEYVMLFICLLMLPGLACELSSGGLPVETETPIPTYPVTTTPLISLSPTSPATSVSLPPLKPGETAEITVDLIAPDIPGPHNGYWQVQLDDGTRLRERFFVRVNVLAPTDPATAIGTTTSPVMPVIDRTCALTQK